MLGQGFCLQGTAVFGELRGGAETLCVSACGSLLCLVVVSLSRLAGLLISLSAFAYFLQIFVYKEVNVSGKRCTAPT